ncbi:uncharacterized protein LOC130453388 [Diorhabda sublineata]|uniref:uncharacterized protein LOC130453388 n=1 Tax=Diorhabda sublineata TaxID=1163346 RepID=UPI0024E0D759|nr:uncharacterized protein LOC130453388 [Diorhabda sublineata]
MVLKVIRLFFVIVFCSQVIGRLTQEDLLEWVPYDPNDVPSDAIPTGHTMEDKRIYIGRVHLLDGDKEGYVPSNIIEGEECVYGLLDSDIKYVCQNISILIGKNTYLSDVFWYTARPSYFMSLFDSDEYHPVRVGWEVGTDNGTPFNSSLYFARVYFGGQYWNSKIYTSRPDEEKNNIGYFSYVNFYSGDVECYGGSYYDVLLFKF